MQAFYPAKTKKGLRNWSHAKNIDTIDWRLYGMERKKNVTALAGYLHGRLVFDKKSRAIVGVIKERIRHVPV